MPNKTTMTAVNSFMVSSNPTTLYGMTVYHKGAADAYLQIHDKSTTPINSDVPVVSLKIRANDNFALGYEMKGREFKFGIWVCLSSTQPTLTLGAADITIDAQV